jgi:hypothetical protein
MCLSYAPELRVEIKKLQETGLHILFPLPRVWGIEET